MGPLPPGSWLASPSTGTKAASDMTNGRRDMTPPPRLALLSRGLHALHWNRTCSGGGSGCPKRWKNTRDAAEKVTRFQKSVGWWRALEQGSTGRAFLMS